MKPLCDFTAACQWACVIFAAASATAANLPSEWQHEQSFTVSTNGLVKIALPMETLDAARPGLEDLRLYDDAGNEMPYLIEHPAPTQKVIKDAKTFRVSMSTNTTVISIETGLAQPVDGVTLETPATGFIKSTRIEGSADGTNWQTLAVGQVIFLQPDGAGQLHLPFPAGWWSWVRLTVDDQRSQPVPFTGALVRASTLEPVPGEWIPARITERDENPGETRIALNLGAANLQLASVQIETSEPLFTRQITVSVPQVFEDAIREQPIGGGTIYRIAIEGQPASSHLSVPLETLVHPRELVILIKNGDSPPLPVTAVRVERRPVYLEFLVRSSGTYHLLTGNGRCAPPRYDLAALGMNLRSVPVLAVKIPPPSDNPNYHAPEVLAGLEVTGAPLEISEWRFRKLVQMSSPGAQQVELDLDVLAHAQPGLASLRLLNGGNQVPYILQPTSINRALTPDVTAEQDARNPRLSRWIIKLPRAGLPLARLGCTARTPLFQRQISLYEEVADQRGEKHRHPLSAGSWEQTPGRKTKEFALLLNDNPASDTLFLETENGDNPPIELENFKVFYPATRLLFKANREQVIFLYYGNLLVAPPRYDLSLVAAQLLAADKGIASLSSEEQLRASTWRENQVPGKGGVLFWGILAVVVIGLLAVISRLLPKPQAPAK